MHITQKFVNLKILNYISEKPILNKYYSSSHLITKCCSQKVLQLLIFLNGGGGEMGEGMLD